LSNTSSGPRYCDDYASWIAALLFSPVSEGIWWNLRLGNGCRLTVLGEWLAQATSLPGEAAFAAKSPSVPSQVIDEIEVSKQPFDNL